MFLSDLSIQRPVFTSMVIIALMSLGLLAVRDIGVDLFPDVSFPVVSINTVYPGAGPEEIEQQVTKPIEEAVSSINGVDSVRSYSRDSVSTVIVLFKLEADIKAAGTDVRDKLSSIRAKLPLDIRDPVVNRLDVTAVPVVTYALSSSRNAAETRRIADDLVKPKLEAVDGVAAVTVNGGLEREIQIQVDRRKLDGLGLSLAQLQQQLAGEGVALPAGRVTTGAYETNVKADGRFRSVEEIGELVVASLATGAQVKLRDVATIADTFKDVRTLVRLDGRPSVTVEVQKQGGSNTVAIADKVLKVMAELEGVLPKDVQVVKVIDSSTFIRRNIDAVEHDILFGGLMAVLVIFLFMLDWRSTLISSLSLPTSVITTFLAMKWLGFTFNMMSLLALSLSIGLLIDDAVVVRENIFRHMEKGKDPITAAREGTAEIGLAVMATTFTIVAVFVPVAFMGGIVGRMFKQFGLTVAAAVLVSLFISFTLDPMMSARVMKPVDPDHHKKLARHPIAGPILRFYEWMDGYYRGVLGWALTNKKTVVALVTLAFVGSLGLTKYMGKEFMSPQDRGEFRLSLEMPAGTSIREMAKVTAEVEEIVRAASPEVRTIFATIGPSEEANKTNLRVMTTKKHERPKVTQWDVQDAIREALVSVPGLRFSIGEIGMIEGGGNDYPITLYVRGENYETLQEIARRTLDLVKSTPGAVDADMSYRAGKPETSIRVDRAKAADLGVSAIAVAQTTRIAIEGAVVAKFRDGDRENDVRLFLDDASRNDPAVIPELLVPATGRRLGAAPAMGARFVRVGEVAEVKAGSGPGTIERMNRQRQIIITAGVKDRSLGEVVADVERGLAAMKVPAGYTFAFDGQAKNMAETFANMGLALATAILFIFFVLASQFESVIHPFTIMLALPLAIVGALLGLFLTGSAIGMPAMIGIILLMGLVTKNAILLVDYTNELRERGYRMMDALLEAGPTRLRPILMTSAAMVLGMLPSAMSNEEGSEFKAPMALAVIGGVIASTVLTLIVIPIVYTWLDRFTSRGRAEAKEGALKPERKPVRVADHEPVAAPVPALRVASEETVTAALVTLGAAAPVLTLDAALGEARANSLDLKAAEQKLAQANEASAKVWSSYLPSLSVGAQYTYNNVEAKIGMPTGYEIRQLQMKDGTAIPTSKNPCGDGPAAGLQNCPSTYYMQPTGFMEAVVQAHHQVGAAATLNQAILAPALLAGAKAAEFGVQSAELAIENARRELLFGVAQLYFGAVSAREAVKVQEQLLASNAAHEKDAETRVKAGALPQVVLLRARIDRVRSEQDVVRARNSYEGLKSSLATLLNRTDDFDVAAPGEPAAPQIPEDPATLLRNRPDVKAARASVESADWGASVPKMKYLPNVGLTGRLQYSNIGGFAGQNTTWNVGVGLSWNLFDGGLREAEVREAAAKLEEARINERSLELKAKDEIRRARLDLESALANRTKAAEQLSLARENARLVQASFGAGVATYIEVSDAAMAVAGAELAGLAESLNAQLAVLRLAKAAGAFDPK